MNTVDRLRAGRAAKVVEEAVARELALQAELDNIDAMIKRADDNYIRAFNKATAKAQDDPVLWRRANEAQGAVLNALARKRFLEQRLGAV